MQQLLIGRRLGWRVWTVGALWKLEVTVLCVSADLRSQTLHKLVYFVGTAGGLARM